MPSNDFISAVILLTKQKDKAISMATVNKLFKLHNEAFNGEVYGMKLYEALMDLSMDGVLDEDEVNRLYCLSVDWPLDTPIE